MYAPLLSSTTLFSLFLSLLYRHVQCVLNFADNLEEDGGTIIVPRFHQHVKSWCAENIHLRKKVPFLVFEKPYIKDKVEVELTSDVLDDGRAIEKVSVEDSSSISNCETSQFPSKNSKSKKSFNGGGNGRGLGKGKGCRKTTAAVSSVSQEDPLLALAHRIPMKQVSQMRTKLT